MAEITQLPGSGARRGDIQGLRALAVVLVVVYHADLGLSGGFVGVDVFFVISGYVITRMLVAELGRSDRVSLRSFYLRRVRRLLPALGVMLTVVMLASSLLAPLGGQRTTAKTGGAAALFNANTYLIRFGGAGYFDVDANVNALLHTWSLSVEEQFYFVFPATLYSVWTLGRRFPQVGARKTVAIALTLIAALSFALSWTLTMGRLDFLGIDGLSGQFAFYSSFTRAWEFAVGSLLVLASRRLATLAPAVEWLLVTLGVALVGYSAVQFDGLTPFPGTAALVPVAGTLCILAAGEGRPSNLVSKGLAVRPFQFVGDLSYSWYLWHWPFIVFAAALWPGVPQALVIGAALSILPAWLSYRFVEQPIRFSPGTTRRTLALAAACIVLPIGAAVVLDGANRIVSRTDEVSDLEIALRSHADRDLGCNEELPLGQGHTPACTWPVSGDSRTAFLIGDSHAGHFTEAFTGAANESGLSAIVVTRHGCPFVDLIPVQNGVRDDSCQSFVDRSTLELVDDPPDVVVIALNSTWYIESSEWSFEDPLAGDSGRTAEAKARLWTEGLTRTIERLTDAGIEVVVVNVVPSIPDFDPRECAVLRLVSGAPSCAPSVHRDIADQGRARSVQAEVAAAMRTGATTLDVADKLCPQGRCASRQDGVWIWSDSSHISVDASLKLIPVFSALFS